MFNRITENFNYNFDDTLFNIKDSEARKKFYLPPYCVFIEDEKALSNYKNTSDYRVLSNLGADTVMRLFRQLRSETNYYISSTQNTTRVAKIVRELENNYIKILGSYLDGNLPWYQSKIKKKEHKLLRKFKNKVSKKAKKNLLKAEEWGHSDNSKIKSKLFKLWDKKKKIIACSYLVYKIRLASRLEDLENDKDCDEFRMVFPVSWLWGVYRTCEYADFYEFLEKESCVKSDQELEQISSLYQSNEEKFKQMISNADDEQAKRTYKKELAKQKAKAKAKEESKEEKNE